MKWNESYVGEGALSSLRSPCHRPPQKLQIDCGALQDHLILYTFYLMHLSLAGFVSVLGLYVCFFFFVFFCVCLS